MSSPEVCKASLITFEKHFHNDVFKWIEWKMSTCNVKDAEILDFSVDDCVFSHLLSQSMKAKRIVTAVRGEPSEMIDKSIEIKRINGFKNDQLSELNGLGKFDVIIVHEVTHEVEDLILFLQKLKEILKSDDGRIFILAHPKNPPPPIPDVAVSFWRKLAPNREDVILAAKAGGLGQVCYAASCPIKVAKQEWYNVLKTRCYPALKMCAKCTDKEIRDYVNSIRMWVLFEEKVLIFLVTPRPEQGDAMEKEVEPSTKNPVAPGGAPSQAANTPALLLAGGQAVGTAPSALDANSQSSAGSIAPAAATSAEPPSSILTSAPVTDEPTAAPIPPLIEGVCLISKVTEPESQENAPCTDGEHCGEGHSPAQPNPQPPLPPGTISPLPAQEKAAGIIAEKVVARAQLKTQPSVAEDFPDSGDEEES